LDEAEREEPVILLWDHARPHDSKTTKKKVSDLGWEVLPHAPYSPDKAPSDFHLFRSLKGWLKGKRYGTVEEVRAEVQEFFDSKGGDFYVRGINNLVDRWEEIIHFGGDYCT
jgi:histone-lysine N-methyltransferase SETMAR